MTGDRTQTTKRGPLWTPKGRPQAPSSCVHASARQWPGIKTAKTTFPVRVTSNSDQTTAPDRSWWKDVYRAGIKADLDKQPRTPPDGLTEDQRDVWLAGYDR